MKNAERTDNIEGTGGSMRTEIHLSELTGQLTGVTRTWTHQKMRGFTGGIQVVLFTSDGRGWVSQLHSYGVDGEWIGRNDRTDPWQEQVPVEVARDANRVAVIHNHHPKVDNLLHAILTGVRTFADAISELSADLGPVIVALS